MLPSPYLQCVNAGRAAVLAHSRLAPLPHRCIDVSAADAAQRGGMRHACRCTGQMANGVMRRQLQHGVATCASSSSSSSSSVRSSTNRAD